MIIGYGDLGCYGQESIHTRVLDRMAAEGMHRGLLSVSPTGG